MTVPIIDTHALVVSDNLSRYPASPLAGRRSAWSAERAVTGEQMITAMNDAGIAKTVLLQSSTTYGFDNEYVADVVAAHRDRFCGAFSVNILDERAAEQMQYWFARGLTSMRVFARGSTLKEAWLRLDDPRAAKAWDCARDLGIPVSTNAAELPQVKAILNRYKGLNIILEHVTRPEIAEGPPYRGLYDLLELVSYSHLHIRITPRTFAACQRGKATSETYVAALIDAFGATRIMWGSYFPPVQAPLRDIVDQLLSVLAGCCEPDRQAILCDTAMKLFPALR